MGCGVCAHRERATIEAEASVDGASLRDLALRFAVTSGAIKKHLAHHPRAVDASVPTASPLPSARDAAARTLSRKARTRNALVTLAPPAPTNGDPPVTVEQAPRTEREEEAPATSRSSELAGARARSARQRLEDVLDRIEEILDELHGDEVDRGAKLAVLRSLVSPIRLLGQFTGEVGATETAVAASPFYRRVRTAIVEALRPNEFAAARDAVISALEQLEGPTGADRSEAAE